MYPSVTVLSLVLSVATAYPAIMSSLDETLNTIHNYIEITNLAGELLVDDIHEELLRKKCQANGGSATAYQTAKAAGFEFTQCVQKIINFSELQKEIAAARPTGDLNEVFAKYCGRKNEFKDCFRTFMESSQVCLEKDELKQRKVVDRIVDKFIDFVCLKDGNRIAMFIADKGPECLKEKSQALLDCANSTYGLVGDSDPLDPLNGFGSLPQLKEIPSIAFGKKDCLKMNKLQQCVVSAVEACDHSTPANLIETIFNYVRKTTPCHKLVDPVPKLVTKY